jgi:hypothetical protein
MGVKKPLTVTEYDNEPDFFDAPKTELIYAPYLIPADKPTLEDCIQELSPELKDCIYDIDKTLKKL